MRVLPLRRVHMGAGKKWGEFSHGAHKQGPCQSNTLVLFPSNFGILVLLSRGWGWGGLRLNAALQPAPAPFMSLRGPPSAHVRRQEFKVPITTEPSKQRIELDVHQKAFMGPGPKICTFVLRHLDQMPMNVNCTRRLQDSGTGTATLSLSCKAVGYGMDVLQVQSLVDEETESRSGCALL